MGALKLPFFSTFIKLFLFKILCDSYQLIGRINETKINRSVLNFLVSIFFSFYYLNLLKYVQILII